MKFPRMTFLIQYLRAFVLVSSKYSLFLVIALSCSDSDHKKDDLDFSTILNQPLQIEEYLENLADEKDYIEYKVLGKSEDGGYNISRIDFFDPETKEKPKPEILIVSAIHGNETTSLYVILKLIDYLDKERKSDRIDDLLKKKNINIITVANPWGVHNNIRTNDNSVDLNRNFGFAWQDLPSHGMAPFDQAETMLIRDDALNNNYYMNLSFHAGESCISTVWDYIGTTESEGTPSEYSYEQFSTEYLPNAETVFDLADKYSNTVNSHGDERFYAVEGYDWYVCYGTLGDWMFAERGSMPFTIEVSYIKDTDKKDLLEDLWEYQRDAVLDLIETDENLVTGALYNAQTLKPVIGKVSLIRINRSYRDPVPYTLFALSSNEHGGFALFADPGSYELSVTAEGYEPAVMNYTVKSKNDQIEIFLTPDE